MQTIEGDSQTAAEFAAPSVIRVETALSRYPVHRLAKQGTVSIEIREKSPDGEMVIQWEVSHSSRYGQPGPLAYKIDTLIVNRRIEEASRPIPKIIKLGSIHDICRELGLRGGKPRENVKKSLHQNAFVGIKAKFRYKLADGKSKELEALFTRYSVVFTGEELPDGRRADAVYLVLNEVFMQVINGAQTRPLDYEYLKDLPPASQRLYELLSFQMYATLKYARQEARLSYAEFCTYAPLTRCQKWDQVRPQMARIHRPHLKSGYIDSVGFEQSVDKSGKPDWLMVYVPGPKAMAEFRAFTKRGGPRVLETEMPPPAPESSPPIQAEQLLIERELVGRGVTASTARDLVAEFTEERIAIQVEIFDWLAKHHPKKVSDSPGGYLVKAIRGDYAPPAKFVSKSEQERRDSERSQKNQDEAKAIGQERAKQARESDAHKRVLEHWESLSPEEQQRLDKDAEANAAPAVLDGYRECSKGRVALREMYFKTSIRWPHIRRFLGLTQT